MTQITHLGTATTVIDIGGVRLVTDPAFDPPATRISDQGLLRMTPAVAGPDPRGVNAVLLSHTGHPDNFDDSGRAFAEAVGLVIGGVDAVDVPGARSLSPWESTKVGSVTVTAVPGRHGPAELVDFVGPVTGFVIESAETGETVYFSGDTVLIDELASIPVRHPIQIAMLNMGAARIEGLGPVNLTMSGADAAFLTLALDPRVVIPLHYSGWQHFTESDDDVNRAFAAADLSHRLRWLRPGEPTEV